MQKFLILFSLLTIISLNGKVLGIIRDTTILNIEGSGAVIIPFIKIWCPACLLPAGTHLSAHAAPPVKSQVFLILTLSFCYRAEDELRAKAVGHRSTAQAFYQITAADVLNKGLLFPQRMPVYFTYADILTVYWSSDLLSSLEGAAEVSKGHDLRVMNAQNYQLFVNQYEKDRVKEAILSSWLELNDSFK